jgi:hypothetical protein
VTTMEDRTQVPRVEVFKPIRGPVPGKVQGNVFTIVEVLPHAVRVEECSELVELPVELIGWAEVCNGLTGPAEFCKLPNGHHCIDWIV